MQNLPLPLRFDPDRLRRLLEDVPVDAAHVLHGYHQLGPAFMKVLQDFGVPAPDQSIREQAAA